MSLLLVQSLDLLRIDWFKMSDPIYDTLTFVRVLIDDVESPYEYSDDRLITLIMVASNYVNMDTSSSYTINLCGQTISPTPDANFINLTALKAACMLLRSNHTSWARNDFRVSDGPTTVDLKGIADKTKVAADSICNLYEKAKLDQIMGRSISGYIISTPSSQDY